MAPTGIEIDVYVLPTRSCQMVPNLVLRTSDSTDDRAMSPCPKMV
jgi:hypothetical protein